MTISFVFDNYVPETIPWKWHYNTVTYLEDWDPTEKQVISGKWVGKTVEVED